MRVRLKTHLAPVSVMALWLLSGMAVAGDKGCLTCSPPPAPPPPPIPPYGGCVGSCTPVTPPVVCCGGGGLNVNVNINTVNASANASSEARARAYSASGASAGARSVVVVGGGGGAYFNVDQSYPMTASGMATEGSVSQLVRTPYTTTRSWEKRYRIQAVCLDDRGIPHPASQVRPSRDVLEDYDGEIYRCIVGTKLQWTKTDLEADTGEAITCIKGQSLWYSGKVLECRAQKPERDCHERSLLRRYGAGEKLLVIRGEETLTEYREEVVERSLATSGSMMMDGGVGGRVF